MKSQLKDIKAQAVSSGVLGTYEGECADANITNKNGLDITREVWENVFNSAEYAEAIKYGWYIGFLGHPEDPACQDFEHACIVMTDGGIDANGKIYGSFNLVDTPVGRVVKAFQDAGVTFGISVRGAGDIISNSVDPETFVFRGFDLVAFPAYPEAIPTFTSIAASSDPAKQKQYKIVCETVRENVDKITDKNTIDIIKQNFAPQSDEYAILANREEELNHHDAEKPEEVDEDKEDLTATVDLLRAKVGGVTNLYLDSLLANKKLNKQLAAVKAELQHAQSRQSRKIKSMHRIMSAQMADIQKTNQEDLDSMSKSNLIYKQRVKSSTAIIKKQADEISDLKSRLRETVTASSKLETRTSNLDETVRKLNEKITAYESLIAQYQDEYAKLYCSVLGTDPYGIKVTASTSVEDLKDLASANSATNMANMLVEPEILDIDDHLDEDDIDSIISM